MGLPNVTCVSPTESSTAMHSHPSPRPESAYRFLRKYASTMAACSSKSCRNRDKSLEVLPLEDLCDPPGEVCPFLLGVLLLPLKMNSLDA
eukprot:1510190-Amphidinium_carterae.3